MEDCGDGGGELMNGDSLHHKSKRITYTLRFSYFDPGSCEIHALTTFLLEIFT